MVVVLNMVDDAAKQGLESIPARSTISSASMSSDGIARQEHRPDHTGGTHRHPAIRDGDLRSSHRGCHPGLEMLVGRRKPPGAQGFGDDGSHEAAQTIADGSSHGTMTAESSPPTGTFAREAPTSPSEETPPRTDLDSILTRHPESRSLGSCRDAPLSSSLGSYLQN